MTEEIDSVKQEVLRLIALRVKNNKILGGYGDKDRYSDYDNYHNHLDYDSDGNIFFDVQYHDCPLCDDWFEGKAKLINGQWTIIESKATTR